MSDTSFGSLMPFAPARDTLLERQSSAFPGGMMTIAALIGAGAGMEYSGNKGVAAGTRIAGQRQAVAYQFQAEQNRINAGQAIAAGQRDAAEQARQARLINSRAQALAAASGAGALDPSVVHIMQVNAGEGAYKAAVALYQGEERARSMRMAAAANDFNANMAVSDANLKADAYDRAAIGGLFKGATSLASRFGYDKPKVNDTGAKWTSGESLPTGNTWAADTSASGWGTY